MKKIIVLQIAFTILMLLLPERIYADESRPPTRIYEISAGAGYLELFYGGLRMKTSEAVWLGFRAGAVPEEMVRKLRALSFDVYIYPSQKPKYYIKPGITYNYKETDELISNMVFLNIQAGRGFSFSDNFGMRLDAGVNFFMMNIERKKKNYEEPFLDNMNINFFPGINFEFYYLLN